MTREGGIRPYDVFVDSKWLFLIVGFAPSDSRLYTFFRITLFVFNSYILAMSSYTMVLLRSNKNLAIDAFHVFLASVWLYWCIITRLLTDRWLRKMREMTNNGIYNYQYENLVEEQLAMHRGIKEDVRRKSRTILLIYICGVSSVMFFFPLSEYLLNKDDPSQEEKLVNPYLPHVYYSPYNTRTSIGYTVAYLVDFLFWIITYVTAVSTNGIVISSTVQIKTQLQVLIYSLKNIQQRAYMLYANGCNVSQVDASIDDLLAQANFQRCLNICLRANIEHHQAVLRFKKTCQPFNGSGILNVFTITTIVYAATLYSMFQKPSINAMVNYIGTFVAENSYSYFICHFGEEVKEESLALFEVLYDTAWYNYNKNFKQMLHIMMANTKKPLVIDAHLLDFSATMESYSKLLAAVYKVMNVWRQSERIK